MKARKIVYENYKIQKFKQFLVFVIFFFIGFKKKKIKKITSLKIKKLCFFFISFHYSFLILLKLKIFYFISYCFIRPLLGVK